MHFSVGNSIKLMSRNSHFGCILIPGAETGRNHGATAAAAAAAAAASKGKKGRNYYNYVPSTSRQASRFPKFVGFSLGLMMSTFWS